MEQEYIRSGHFIHDELIRRCGPLTATVMKHFRRDKLIMPTLLIWPADSVKSLDGNMFTGVIFSDLSTDEAVRKQEIKDSILRTAAFAALVTEQLPEAVRMIFESGHGTRTWRLPIKNHGNVQVLERLPPRDNTESLGVLWTAN